jgi:hypothetical protein
MASQSTEPLKTSREDSQDDDLNQLENEALTGPDSDSGNGLSAAAKRKQKRNKPTLSCGECVERKTKVSQYQNSKPCFVDQLLTLTCT